MSTDTKTADNAAEFHADVDDVFARIASRYDLLCDLFSLFIHRRWKSRVAALIAAQPWNCLLDGASGTGHVVLRVAQRVTLQPYQKVIASDLSQQMLAIARRRAGHLAKSIDFRILDAHQMPTIADSSVDLYSFSLGLKICDRHLVLREAMRVLRPGGTLITLEASHLPSAALRRAYLAYMNLCMPVVAWVATGGDASAYRYLLKGIHEFPGAEEFAGELRAMGFENVSYERLSLGIVAIHIARKP